MNILRSMMKPFNRRVANVSVNDDRRDTATHRLNAVNKRLDAAIDDLCQTVSMSRSDFDKLIERDRQSDILNFSAFSERCKFRYINGDGTTAKCNNPEHEKICTGQELCAQIICPRLRKPE